MAKKSEFFSTRNIASPSPLPRRIRDRRIREARDFSGDGVLGRKRWGDRRLGDRRQKTKRASHGPWATTLIERRLEFGPCF
jgi:hypothetical protein